MVLNCLVWAHWVSHLAFRQCLLVLIWENMEGLGVVERVDMLLFL